MQGGQERTRLSFELGILGCETLRAPSHCAYRLKYIEAYLGCSVLSEPNMENAVGPYSRNGEPYYRQ